MRLLLCLVPLLTLFHGTAEAEEAPFERRDLQTEHPIVQDAVPVRLGDDEARHLLVVTSPDRKRVVVELFAPDAQGVPAGPPRRLSLPDDVVAFDVARSGADGRETVYFLTPRELLRLDPDTAALRRVRDVRSIYRRPVPGRLLTPNFLRDVDGSAPLLVLPDFDGVHVGRNFLPVAPRTLHDERGPAYHPAAIGLQDLDLDGRVDAFLISEDALHVFRGRDSSFSEVALVQPLRLGIGRDPAEGDLGEVDQSDLTTRRVVAIEDFDGDERIDLLIESQHRSGVLDRKTSLDLHLGHGGSSGVSWSVQPTTSIGAEGPLGDLRVVDIDGDGRRDVAAGSIDFGIGTLVSALLTGSVDIDVLFFRLGEDGHYPEQPSATREAEIEFDLSKGQASIPVVLLADTDGDGDRDLVVREEQDELRVYPADGSGDLFADSPQKAAVPLPNNGQLVARADLNGDARDDLLVRYGHLDGGEAKRRLVLLLGRAPGAPKIS